MAAIKDTAEAVIHTASRRRAAIRTSSRLLIGTHFKSDFPAADLRHKENTSAGLDVAGSSPVSQSPVAQRAHPHHLLYFPCSEPVDRLPELDRGIAPPPPAQRARFRAILSRADANLPR